MLRVTYTCYDCGKVETKDVEGEAEAFFKSNDDNCTLLCDKCFQKVSNKENSLNGMIITCSRCNQKGYLFNITVEQFEEATKNKPFVCPFCCEEIKQRRILESN